MTAAPLALLVNPEICYDLADILIGSFMYSAGREKYV